MIACLFVNPVVLAADSGQGAAPFSSFFVFVVATVAIWYFLVIRPQQQQRRKLQDLLANLKSGDRVVTSGGIYGTILGFRNGVVQLQIANQVKVDVARSAITGLAGEGSEEPGKSESGTKGKK